jgi:hypothetical protein
VQGRFDYAASPDYAARERVSMHQCCRLLGETPLARPPAQDATGRGFAAKLCSLATPVARFVERELRAYLTCGILAEGFLRVHCDACGHDRMVAFSCKGRGLCPSCGGRRMADTAPHLVDRVLPEVPTRQWILTLPYPLRYRCAWDARITSEVLRAFMRMPI